jgi:putative sigma-54 modulation protein
MNIDIQSPGFPITAALADHVRRRLRFGLTRHSDRIQRVIVRLGDQNGPRGGIDKFCRIRVYLVDAPMAVVLDIGTDLHELIGRTADRVSRAVIRHLDRSRNSARRVRGDGPRLFEESLDSKPQSIHIEGERT